MLDLVIDIPNNNRKYINRFAIFIKAKLSFNKQILILPCKIAYKFGLNLYEVANLQLYTSFDSNFKLQYNLFYIF